MLAPSDYQALFAALPDLHLALTPELTIVAASAGAAAVAGLPLAQVIGRNAAELFGAASGNSVAPVGVGMREAVAQVLASHASHELITAGWQHRAWPVSAEASAEIRHVLYRATPVPVQEDQPTPPAFSYEVAAGNQHFQGLLDTLPVMVWTTYADGSADYESPRWLRYTGYAQADAEAGGWLTAVHPDDQARAGAAWQNALATGREYSIEYRLRRHDGQFRWQQVQVVPARTATGEIASWTGTLLDIQEQKETQQRLTHQDRHLQQILSQVPAHIATLLGPDHVYGFLNEKGNQLFGGNVQLGMPAALAVPELVTNGYIKLVDEIYRTGEPFVLSEMPMVQPPAADGSVATLYFDGVLQPLTDEQNRTQGILVFGVDVTERVLAKQRTAELVAEIREQNAQFRTMVESLPLFVYITDEDGKMLYVNPQRYAFTGQQPVADLRDWAAPLHPDDRARVQADFAEGRVRRQPWSGEYRLRRHDGHYRWQLLRAVPQLRPDGSVARWYGSSVDIDDQKQFQQQLEAKDAYLRQILSQTPAKIATLQGPEHRYAFFNERYNLLVGGRAVLGQRVADCLPELAQQGFLTMLDNVYRTQETYVGHEQSLWLTPPGDTEARQYFLNLTYQALHGADGAVEGILAFIVDVTEKVLARQRTETLTTQLQYSDERLRRMTEALPVMTFINDAHGRTEYTSPQWWHYAGYPEGTDVNAVWDELLHPDDRARANAEYAAALAEKRGWNLEVRLRRHDGQYRWHLSHTVPAETAEGLKWYGSTVDIHEQKRLSQELAASTAHFSQLLEALPQLTWTARPEDGHVTYTNRSFQAYTGATAEELLGLRWTDFVHPEDKAITSANLPAVIEQGALHQTEHRLRGADGRYRWFLGSLLPLRDAAGNITQWLGTNADVDDFKQIQQQLQARNEQLARTNADLDNFVYTASHDLRQPINNMAGIFEELTRTAYFRDRDAVQLISMFERALQQINQTIQDLSDVVQLQRRHAQVPTEVVVLEPLTREVLSSMQEQITARQATVSLDFGAVPAVRFVRANLQSILYNLLSNALKYAAPGRPPVVHIRSEMAEGVPVLSVADNGQGIDLERHGKELFQLFRRFHEDVEGSGMGLYLVNRMVQLNGGWLAVDSAVGVGTTFRIYCKD